jgi:hypothetical protein
MLFTKSANNREQNRKDNFRVSQGSIVPATSQKLRLTQRLGALHANLANIQNVTTYAFLVQRRRARGHYLAFPVCYTTRNDWVARELGDRSTSAQYELREQRPSVDASSTGGVRSFKAVPAPIALPFTAHEPFENSSSPTRSLRLTPGRYKPDSPFCCPMKINCTS